jgi:hypothetical protein
MHVRAKPRRLQGRHLTPLGLALGGAGVLLDCIVQQLIADGGADLDLVARWTASTLLPWMFVVYAIRRAIERDAPLDRPSEALLLASTFAGSVALDLLLFQPDAWSATEILARMQARLPIMLVAPLLARLAIPRSARRTEATPGAPLAMALRECLTCTAAGNYVEIDDGRRRHLLRATMRDVEAAIGGRHVRIHRSAIVAWAMIDRVERDRHGICGVRLSDGRRLPVGRAYRKRLRGL